MVKAKLGGAVVHATWGFTLHVSPLPDVPAGSTAMLTLELDGVMGSWHVASAQACRHAQLTTSTAFHRTLALALSAPDTPFEQRIDAFRLVTQLTLAVLPFIELEELVHTCYLVLGGEVAEAATEFLAGLAERDPLRRAELLSIVLRSLPNAMQAARTMSGLQAFFKLLELTWEVPAVHAKLREIGSVCICATHTSIVTGPGLVFYSTRPLLSALLPAMIFVWRHHTHSGATSHGCATHILVLRAMAVPHTLWCYEPWLCHTHSGAMSLCLVYVCPCELVAPLRSPSPPSPLCAGLASGGPGGVNPPTHRCRGAAAGLTLPR